MICESMNVFSLVKTQVYKIIYKNVLGASINHVDMEGGRAGVVAKCPYYYTSLIKRLFVYQGG